MARAMAHLFPPFAAGHLLAYLYRFAGFEVGAGSAIGGPLQVIGPGRFEEKLTIGREVVIATNVTINVDAPVTIEDNVSIGPFVRIYTGTHAIGPGSRRMMTHVTPRPVRIGKGSWIGLGTIVLPGVTVGDGCVIGAGSVVTSDIQPNTYAEGNPATTVRNLPWGDR